MRDEVSPRRRPVSMYGVPLGLGSLGSPSSSSSAGAAAAGAGGETATPPRLKRLSLVAAREGSPRVSTPRSRRATGGNGGESDVGLSRSPARHAAGDSMSSTDTTASSRGSTDSCAPASASPLLSPTPRRVAARSSISYSPSTWRAPSAGADGGAESSGADGAGAGIAGSATGLTLAERHSDLLRTIAMRERRVNELRQELAVQEEALTALRRRWTAIARADAMAEPPAPRRSAAASGGAGAGRGRSPADNGVAVASAQRTTSPTPTTPTATTKAEPSPAAKVAAADVSSLWHTLTADADETIQEGKRFWGQLLRTVGAAAGASEPGAATRTPSTSESADDKLDLSRILPALGLAPALPGTSTRRTPSPASPASPAAEASTPSNDTTAARKVAGVRLRRAALSNRPRPLTGSERVSDGATSPAPDHGAVPPSAQDLSDNTRPEQDTAAGGDDAASPDDGASSSPGSPSASPLSPRPPVTAVLDSMGW